MKLDELRREMREDPTARNCHICAWTSTRKRARYVMSGANGQWYDCGEHPDEPNGKPLFKEDIGEWFLKHGLVEGKRAPEVPEPTPEAKGSKAQLDALALLVQDVDGRVRKRLFMGGEEDELDELRRRGEVDFIAEAWSGHEVVAITERGRARILKARPDTPVAVSKDELERDDIDFS